MIKFKTRSKKLSLLAVIVATLAVKVSGEPFIFKTTLLALTDQIGANALVLRSFSLSPNKENCLFFFEPTSYSDVTDNSLMKIYTTANNFGNSGSISVPEGVVSAAFVSDTKVAVIEKTTSNGNIESVVNLYSYDSFAISNPVELDTFSDKEDVLGSRIKASRNGDLLAYLDTDLVPYFHSLGDEFDHTQVQFYNPAPAKIEFPPDLDNPFIIGGKYTSIFFFDYSITTMSSESVLFMGQRLDSSRAQYKVTPPRNQPISFAFTEHKTDHFFVGFKYSNSLNIGTYAQITADGLEEKGNLVNEGTSIGFLEDSVINVPKSEYFFGILTETSNPFAEEETKSFVILIKGKSGIEEKIMSYRDVTERLLPTIPGADHNLITSIQVVDPDAQKYILSGYGQKSSADFSWASVRTIAFEKKCHEDCATCSAFEDAEACLTCASGQEIMGPGGCGCDGSCLACETDDDAAKCTLCKPGFYFKEATAGDTYGTCTEIASEIKERELIINHLNREIFDIDFQMRLLDNYADIIFDSQKSMEDRKATVDSLNALITDRNSDIPERKTNYQNFLLVATAKKEELTQRKALLEDLDLDSTSRKIMIEAIDAKIKAEEDFMKKVAGALKTELVEKETLKTNFDGLKTTLTNEKATRAAELTFKTAHATTLTGDVTTETTREANLQTILDGKAQELTDSTASLTTAGTNFDAIDDSDADETALDGEITALEASITLEETITAGSDSVASLQSDIATSRGSSSTAYSNLISRHKELHVILRENIDLSKEIITLEKKYFEQVKLAKQIEEEQQRGQEVVKVKDLTSFTSYNGVTLEGCVKLDQTTGLCEKCANGMAMNQDSTSCVKCDLEGCKTCEMGDNQAVSCTQCFVGKTLVSGGNGVQVCS